ncbi:MAG: flavodoxin reductase [Gammaproteobacteria bacterium]|nr:flavodoxin reductase [Gammaproteobacteria bacterium]
MTHSVTLLMSEFVTHDVKRYIVTRPDGFEFTPGQGVELAIDRDKWSEEGRPFTPTSHPDDKVIEFTIKTYEEHEGVTRELSRLKPGAKLTMSDPFGTISYQGPGVFLGAGAGITPFIAIFRELASKGEIEKNSLIFSNKTPADVISEKELRHYMGENAHFICTDGDEPGYEYERVDKDYLEKNISDFGQKFYVCGPPGFMKAVNSALEELGASPESVVFEN